MSVSTLDNEEDLTQVVKRLDADPNFAVDVAARVRYFMRGDREKVAQFLLHYPLHNGLHVAFDLQDPALL